MGKDEGVAETVADTPFLETFEEASLCSDVERQPKRKGSAARRLAVIASVLGGLVGCGVAAAFVLRGPGAQPEAGADAVERGESASEFTLARGAGGSIGGGALGFGSKKSDFQDFLVGAIPKYEDSAAHWGTPPKPPGPRQKSVKQMPGCPGKSCNNGNLCCGSNDKCCGTSCCSHGSICCNAEIGLCCSPGSMCCYRMFCCSNGFACGQSRDSSDGLRFDILKQCGSGGQIRRLSGQLAYKSQLRTLAEANETEFQRITQQQA